MCDINLLTKKETKTVRKGGRQINSEVLLKINYNINLTNLNNYKVDFSFSKFLAVNVPEPANFKNAKLRRGRYLIGSSVYTAFSTNKKNKNQQNINTFDEKTICELSNQKLKINKDA